MSWDHGLSSSLVIFSLDVENDNKPLGSLSFSTTKEKTTRDDDESRGLLSSSATKEKNQGQQ
jgi:hypothetical protein